MKKVLMALVCFVALVLTSCSQDVMNKNPETCDNTTLKCWQVTTSTTVMGVTGSADAFIWGTEREVVVYCQEIVKAANAMVKLKVSYKPAAYKTLESCEDANVDY